MAADTQQMRQGDRDRPTEGIKSLLPDKGPSAGQVMAVAAAFPVGGILLTLAGVTLTGTVIGLAVTTPLFVVFSPVIVPALAAIGLAMFGFVSSAALGLIALSSLSYIFNYVRGIRGKMQEAAGQIGRRTKDVGQGIQATAQEGGGKRVVGLI